MALLGKRCTVLCLIALLTACNSVDVPENTTNLERTANLKPDYSHITIPPNIAPLNFQIKEEGEDFLVRVSSAQGDAILVRDKNGVIQFPQDKWRDLLEQNRGNELQFELFIKQQSEWLQFTLFRNRIAQEKIDPVLVYRLINPAFKYWNKMGIYQRNIETFDQSPVLINRMTEENCMNCHNFCWNDPQNMVFHMRSGKASGTYISVEGDFFKVSLKTDFNRGGAYPSWHPNGNTIAFSVNDLTMFYHSTGENRDVLDRNSDVVVYHIDKNMISASPQIAAEDRMETFPCWSPDGQWLYFCSAPPLETFINKESGDLDYDKIRYNLKRARYNAETDTWGELETVIDAEAFEKSVIIPRLSSDGKFVLFCMSDYGSFPIYHKQSDLFMLDVATGDFAPLNINSDETDSFHCWSSNSRWIVFTSKRLDGILGRPFICYVDEQGRTEKAFVLPQKDPNFYDNFIINYNVPELAKHKIDVSAHALRNLAYDNENVVQATLDPRVKPRGTRDSGDMDALYQGKPIVNASN